MRAGRERIVLPSDSRPPSFRYPVSGPDPYNTVAAAADGPAGSAVGGDCLA